MRSHRPTTQPRRMRRAPEAAAPAEAPAQPVEPLRDPAAPAALRQAAIARAQGAMGNAAVERELARRNYRLADQVSINEAPVAATLQPVPAAHIQRGFFKKLWKGVKSVGKAVAKGVTWAGKGLVKGAVWIAKKAAGLARDQIMLAFNLLRDLPGRLFRLGKALIEGLAGAVTFIPEAIGALASGGLAGLGDWLIAKAKGGAAWLGTLLSRVFDVAGGPEAAELILHLITASTTPLNGSEIGLASSVLGPGAVRWGDVRVNEGGLLDIVFHFNNKRAFTTFHTINIPSGTRGDTSTILHELTHVYQYELVGSLYIGQAIHAQVVRGGDAYSYGDLGAARSKGKHLRDFNREEQAQIAQDYDRLGRPASHEPYIQELRAGAI